MPTTTPVVSEKNAAKEAQYEDIKGVIVRRAPEIIGGAVDKLWQDNGVMGRTDISESEFILEVLKFIAPENPRMWQDEEILEVTREIVRERRFKKTATAPESEEDVQSEEGIADMIRKIEQNPPKKRSD